MVIKNKFSKKIIAALLSLLIVASCIPTGFMISASANGGNDCIAVNLKEKKVYFYGVDSVETDDLTVTYTGGKSSIVSVYVDGSNEIDSSDITSSSHSVTFTEEWLKAQSGWIAVQCSDDVTIPVSEPSVNVDEEAPIINSVTGNSNEWTKNDVTLSINASDVGTGVFSYSIDGVNWKESSDFTVSKNDTYSFYAKDKSGNISAKYDVNVDKIDKVAPTISSVSVLPESWTNGSVTFKVTATDSTPGSGLDEKAYRIDDNEWQQSNEFTVSDSNEHTFSVRDAVGNEASTTQKADKYDAVKPVITDVEAKYGKLTVTSNSYTTKLVDYDFYVTAEDDNSGIAKYSNDGINWQDSNHFKMKGAGNYTFYVMDNALNVSDAYEFSLLEDVTAPTIDSITADITEPTNQDITITVKAHDNDGGAGLNNTAPAYKIDNGSWQKSNQFIISDCEEHTIYVRDSAEPKNITEKKFQATNYCKVKPVISDENIILSTNEWTNKEVTVKIDNVAPTKNSAGKEFPIKQYQMDNGKWQTSNQFTVSDAKDHTFKVKDEAKNISDPITKSVTNFDGKVPTLIDGDSVNFEQKNDNKIAEVLNKLTFGRFFNKELKITVKAEDIADGTNNASGIVEATFTFVGADKKNTICTFDTNDTNANKIVYNADATISFVVENGNLPDNFKGNAKVTLTDRAGNTATYDITTQNSDMANIDPDSDFSFMIEKTPPDISEPSTAGVHKTNYNFEFSVSDKTSSNYSGIAYVKVFANGKEVLFENYQKRNKLLDEVKYSLPVVAVPKSDDEIPYSVNGVELKEKWNKGKIEYVINVCDNAGNTKTSAPIEYSFDQTSPIITGFKIGENAANSVKVDNTYGFYFKKDTNVTVTAEDYVNNDNNEAVASGVASITVYLEDVNGKKYFVPSNNGKIEELTEISQIKELKTTSKSISFVIPANFKGQIYAYATDNAGNSPMSCEYFLDKNDADKDGYVNPDGSIVENAEKHIETSKISINMPKTGSTQNTKFSGYSQRIGSRDAEMDYEKYIKTAESKNVPLYKNNFNANINVYDSYSGINTVKITVIEGKTKTIKTVKIDNNGKISSDNVACEVLSKDSNLVTGLAITDFSVEGNYNDMVIVAELTDNAGNVSYDYYAFGIDKSAPKITVTYDNNDADTKSGKGAFFMKNRTATVIVEERNFNTEKMEWTIKNAEGQAPNHSDVKFIKGTGNRDDDTYVYTVTYSNDGVYSFGLKYTDRAGNKNSSIDYGNSVAPTEFVIDKTLPTINVTFDNNDVRNDKYFNAYRTATITVKEHNFDAGRVTITGTAAVDGNAVKYPTASWNSNGDTHIATVNFNTDADYTFDISMEDMSGNKSKEANYGSSVAPKDFVIDTKIECPVIGGVENGNSYKGSVLPKIDFSDVNFKDAKVTLLRTRKNEINKDVTSDFINVTVNDKGGSYEASEDTFKKIQENDGIYTLLVQITDKAENTSSSEVSFTVNRFGSVYSLGSYLSNDLNNKYVQSINDDIVITEYNPDRLVKGDLDVVVTRDGSPVSYENGELKISPVVNELAKIGSSGWYQYEYTISKNVFTDDNGNPIDGIYKVYVGSQDTVGNKSENISYEDSSVLFRLDHTAPTIKSVSGLDKKIINADKQKVSYEIFDAIGIESIDVYYYGENGTRVDHIRSTDKGNVDLTDVLSDLTNYSGSFVIGSSNVAEPVRIVIKDLAGNVTDTDSDKFDVDSIDFNRMITVSTNFFVRWYANKIVFWVSIAAIAVIAGGLAFFIATKKRKKDEAETEEIKKNARENQE